MLAWQEKGKRKTDMDKNSRKKLIENAVRYAVYFLAVFLTPLVAEPMSDWFLWVGYGRMTPFITNIITMIFWMLEFIAILILEFLLKRKREPALREEEKQLSFEELPSENEKGAGKKERTPPLPLKNLFILTGLVVLCVLFISAQIDFKVKPFYEIGEKVNGYELWNNISGIARNAVKCVWIVLIMRAALDFSETLFSGVSNEKHKRGWAWLGVLSGIMVFALTDVLCSGMSLAFGLTYLFLFYPAFVAVYYFTEQRGVKAYLLIMFIYIF